jgi:tetratricopeptide (TPR) repeat protein
LHLYGAESPVQGRDLDGAIKECQQALTLEPDSSYLPYLHLQIARLFLEKGDFVHAIPEYRTAVQLHPKDESFRRGLVNALEDSGDPDAALAEIKEAIRIRPTTRISTIYWAGCLSRKMIRTPPLLNCDGL